MSAEDHAEIEVILRTGTLADILALLESLEEELDARKDAD